MEKKLMALLDYQRFEGNGNLQNVIDSVHARYAVDKDRYGIRELTMDEMSMLAAAGTSDLEKKNHERT